MKKTIAILSLLPLLVMLSGCGLFFPGFDGPCPTSSTMNPTSPLSGGSGYGGSLQPPGQEEQDCDALHGVWCAYIGPGIEFDTETNTVYYDGESYSFTCTGTTVTYNSQTSNWAVSGGYLTLGSSSFYACGD